MRIKNANGFLENYDAYKLYFYFDREVPNTQLNLTAVYWLLQYQNWCPNNVSVDLSTVTRAIY